MKKSIFLIFMTLVILLNSAITSSAQKINYDSIYNNLPLLDFYYDHNEDPQENVDYDKFVDSPYPLIRISAKLNCRDKKLFPGYYLMTVRNQSDYDFIMFKQNGKIAAMIPVYEKQLIDPLTIYPQPQKPKSKIKRILNKFKSIIGTPFKSYRQPPPQPRYIIKSSMVDGGRYFEISLYQEQYLYKMLFQLDRK